MSDIKLDKNLLAPEDFENTKLITLDDGSQEEVYISRAGNIVTKPQNRSAGNFTDSRQQVCWDLYVKSWRKGEPNAKGAALAAGYSANTAINVTNLAWFKKKKDTLRRSKMMSNAERNLSRILNMDYSKMKIHEDGSEEEVIDKDLLRVVADVSKTIVTTLGKDQGYSTKTEVTGKMDTEIKINSVSYADTIEADVIDVGIKQIEDVQDKVVLDIIEEQNVRDNAAS